MTALVSLLFILSSRAVAQDYFLETLDKANRTTTYEALYILSDYQQFLPSFAATYYHLGVRYYDLIHTEHPIRDYQEFKQNLYRTRLYFGNCLHYAKDQNLKPQHYAGLPYSGKKPEYADLERFIRAKLDTVAVISERSENVYQSYYRLVNRYALCRNMFTAFSELYKREKTAHLLLTDNDREQLTALQVQADSLQNDIQDLQAALQAYPVAGYNPQFTWAEINLYRLDGLTNTDLLQNKVVLWNYAAWVRHFLSEQEEVYTAFYDAIDIEYGLMLRAMSDMQNGKKRVVDPYTILLNRIDRLDYQSFMRDFIESMHRVVSVQQDAFNPAFDTTSIVTNDYIEQALDVLLCQNSNLTRLTKLTAQLQSKLKSDPVQITHYTTLLTKWNCTNTDSIILQQKGFVQVAQQAYTSAATAFATNITPSVQPFENYINDLTGEKFGIGNLQFEPSDTVRTIIPIEDQFMVVAKDGTCFICASDGKLLSTQRHDITDVITAYKHGSNTIALVSDNRVLFVNKEGK